ncbi:murein biosynthesis integral membrane protein MurJ [Psychromicrobium sp. YIM B11713]|uniref:murein biosynthesis integral membrane protein MurJ n=1 Tax=Psychromicrobium sp. YIM B11713 TaxID=3145233 RepID=UPI00374F3404
MADYNPTSSEESSSDHPRVNVARSSAVMAAGTLVSRGLGFFKGVLIAYALGALSDISNIFAISSNIPNLLYIMLAGGVFNAVLVPQIIKASKLPDRGSDFLSRLLSLGVLFMAGITIILTLCAGPLMDFLTQFSGRQLDLSVQFSIWLIPQIFFYGLYALLGQILNAHSRFGAYMWAPVLNNLVAIAGIFVFILIWSGNTSNPHNPGNWSSSQTAVLAGATTLGVILQALILLRPVRKLGLQLRPKWGWRGIGLGATGKIAGWVVGTMVVGQASYLVITWVATKVAENSGDPGMFLFSRASDIYILPHSIIVLSVATVLFSRMARSASSGNRQELRSSVSKLLRTVGAATIFFGGVLLVLSGQLGMLLGGGVASDGLAVGIAVAILSIGSPFLSANFMINRVFYATEDARTPFVLQCILIVFGVASALLVSLVPSNILIYSLLGTVTVGNILAPFLSGFVLRGKIGDFGVARVIRSHVQYLVGTVIASLVGALVLFGLGGATFLGNRFDGFAWQSTWAAVLTILVVGLVMALTYFMALKLMRVSELEELLAPILRRFGRLIPAQSTAHRIGSKAKEGSILSQSVEVGTVLGGRYKVTAHVLVSAEGDQVLDGVDQVLNRPVSIVIAGEENTENLTQGAREVATGERDAGFQILDLGLGDGTAYMIASKSQAADLLDLLIPTSPYVEPHFTDALGVDIFGSARSVEPSIGGYDYVYEDNTPFIPENQAPPRATSLPNVPPPPAVAPRSAGTESSAHPQTAPEATQSPKVSRWTEEETKVSAAPVISSGINEPITAAEPSGRKPGTFPAGAVASVRETSDLDTAYQEDDEINAPRSGRWLVGGVLLLILVLALIFAVPAITGLFSHNQAAPSSSNSAGTQSSSSGNNSSSPSDAPTVTPVITGITQQVQGVTTPANFPDGKLSNLFDGNPATFWQTLEFTNDTYIGTAKSIALVVQLKDPSDISSVSIAQSGGSGGSFEVLSNSKPSLAGAKQIGTGSFTGPNITIPAMDGAPAQYVIINFTQLPKQQSPRTYPYALKIGEITIK